MRKCLLGLIAALVFWRVGFATRCGAQGVFIPSQPPSPIGRPLAGPYFNPYYSPFRPFVPGGVNYGLGQPGFLTATSMTGVPPLLAGQTPLLPQDQVGGVSVTGHPALYFYYSHFYYNRLVGSSLASGPSATGAVSTGILTTAPRSGGTLTTTGPGAGQPTRPPSPMR